MSLALQNPRIACRQTEAGRKRPRPGGHLWENDSPRRVRLSELIPRSSILFSSRRNGSLANSAGTRKTFSGRARYERHSISERRVGGPACHPVWSGSYGQLAIQWETRGPTRAVGDCKRKEPDLHHRALPSRLLDRQGKLQASRGGLDAKARLLSLKKIGQAIAEWRAVCSYKGHRRATSVKLVSRGTSMEKVSIKLVSAMALTLCCLATMSAEVRLPKMLSDHAVLQREAPIHIWGWAEPGRKIDCTLS